MLTQDEYFSGFQMALNTCLSNPRHKQDFEKAILALKKTKETGATIYLIGNGGSSAIAEHMAIDLTKNAGLKALAFSGTPMLTTFANDFGYERIYEKPLRSFARKGDILIAISSSGTSKNILNAVNAAKELGLQVMTLSGFAADNPLRSMGDLNWWVDSRAFGYVELIHNTLLHYINDAIIGKSEYMIR